MMGGGHMDSDKEEEQDTQSGANRLSQSNLGHCQWHMEGITVLDGQVCMLMNETTAFRLMYTTLL